MRLQLLDWLASQLGREVGAGHLISFRFTHQDIAEFLGTIHITGTRAINQFDQ